MTNLERTELEQTIQPVLDRAIQPILDRLDKLTTEVDRLAQDNEKTNTTVDAYQKASTQVVNLAFSLIASATITLIITSVFRR